MSKAFTKDEGEGSSEAPHGPLGPPLPEGARNYVTTAGAQALQARLIEAQADVERRRAAGDAAAVVAAQEQLAFWRGRLEVMELVVPPARADGRVRFGATVETEDDAGRKRSFRIVGVDEADPAAGALAWTSPIAKALLGKEVGDEVSVRTPQGGLQLEILQVSYSG